MTTRISLLAALAAACACPRVGAQDTPARPADDAPAMVLVDRHLRAEPVAIARIDRASIAVRDGTGLERTRAYTEVLAIAPLAWWEGREAAPAPAEPAEGPALGVLELADGQRFPGTLDPAPAGDDEVAWRSAALGPIRVPLDRVHAVRLRPAGGATGAGAGRSGAAPARDEVVLVSGDRITGFVASIGTTVRVEAEGRRVEAPIAEVAEVRLVPEPGAARGLRVWLRDGTAADMASIRPASARRVVLNPGVAGTGATDTEVGIGDLGAVVFAGERLRPLSALAPARTDESSGGPDAQTPGMTAEPGLLGAAPIALRGPAVVAWTLPPGASAVAGLVEIPRGARLWADLEVILVGAVGSGRAEELWRAHVGPDAPSAEFRVDLPKGSTRLELRLEPGAYGPIQDRVVIRRGLVALEPREARPGR